MSTEKTKGMFVGVGFNENDVRPVQVEGGFVDVVQDFTYLGTNISRDGNITSEVTRRIARAARAFGCLRVPVFKNKDLSLATKRSVYRAVVLAVLLYGAETWTMKAVHTRHLNSFHNRCIQTHLFAFKATPPVISAEYHDVLLFSDGFMLLSVLRSF